MFFSKQKTKYGWIPLRRAQGTGLTEKTKCTSLNSWWVSFSCNILCSSWNHIRSSRLTHCWFSDAGTQKMQLLLFLCDCSVHSVLYLKGKMTPLDFQTSNYNYIMLKWPRASFFFFKKRTCLSRIMKWGNVFNILCFIFYPICRNKLKKNQGKKQLFFNCYTFSIFIGKCKWNEAPNIEKTCANCTVSVCFVYILCYWFNITTSNDLS